MYKKALPFCIILFFNVNLVFALSIKSISPNKSIVKQFERFELTLNVADISCPIDELEIIARFTGPVSKDVVVGGFPYHRKYKVRFSPTKTGRYSYKIIIKDGMNIVKSDPYDFNCIPPTEDKYGFLRKWPVNPHRLVFDSNHHFYILGENRINIYNPFWNYENKSIEQYVAYMAENGMTTLRVFIRCGRNIYDTTQCGYLEQGLGCFNEEVADRLDTVLEACEDNDIYLVLVAFALGFTPNDTFKDWGNNPYNKENKGPCNKKEEFFTNQDAITYQEKKLKYIIDRYGYSPHLLSIDLFNEPEWDGGFPEDLWIPWAIETAEYVKGIDPYGHLVTLGSVGTQWNIGEENEEEWYNNNTNDTIQWHLYGIHSPQEISYKMRDFIREYWGCNKPIYCGEFAWGQEPKPAYEHTHNGIWAGLMSGGGVLVHSAPEFTEETDELMTPERASHFIALSGFLKDVQWNKNLQYKTEDISSNLDSLKLWTLKSNDYALIWLLDGDKKKYGQRLDEVTLTLSGMLDGDYIIQWWDTRQGIVIETQKVKCINNCLKLNVPSFRKDIACKIKLFMI